jgi:adenylate cyclase
MHTGPAVERAGDWFGAAVNLAARVSGAAAGGEVLVTEATREAAGEVEEIALIERGRQSLRNVSEPVMLFAAHSAGERSARGLAIDPVCRMAVDPEHAAGSLRHQGVEYHFCSLDCARRFAEAPERYVIRSGSES